MAMATSLAFANPKQFDNGLPLSAVVRTPIASGVDTAAADSTTRIFVRGDCIAPATGSANFYDLTAYRAPSVAPGDLLSGQDCGPANDEDAEG